MTHVSGSKDFRDLSPRPRGLFLDDIFSPGLIRAVSFFSIHKILTPSKSPVMDVKFSLILALVAALNPLGLGFLYTEGDDVAILTSANFEKAVVLSEGVSMVEFYAPCKFSCTFPNPSARLMIDATHGPLSQPLTDHSVISHYPSHHPLTGCGHCKTMAPHYKTVAQKLKGIMTIGAVDCDDVSNKKLCANQGIKGFPTIKLFSGEKMKNP